MCGKLNFAIFRVENVKKTLKLLEPPRFYRVSNLVGFRHQERGERLIMWDTLYLDVGAGCEFGDVTSLAFPPWRSAPAAGDLTDTGKRSILR